MCEPLDVLTTLTQDILDARDCQSRLQLVTDFALRLAPAADHASVRLSQGDGLTVGARSGIGSDRPAHGFRRGEGILGWVAEHGRSVRVGDSQRDPRFKPYTERGFAVGSVVSVPIRARGTTLGVLTLSAPQCDAFTDCDESVANLLAQTAAHALVTSDLERQTITDAQTLAYNRGHLYPRLEQEMARTQREGSFLSILLMDIDYFKRVNDEHGHRVGDELLRAFADVIRSGIRSSDVLVRRGGEEFVLVMPATRECAAVTVADRLRKRVAGQPLLSRPNLRVEATISIGIAGWDGREPATALDERADQAMYEAKRRGRNRSVRAAELRSSLALCAGDRHP